MKNYACIAAAALLCQAPIAVGATVVGFNFGTDTNVGGAPYQNVASTLAGDISITDVDAVTAGAQAWAFSGAGTNLRFDSAGNPGAAMQLEGWDTTTRLGFTFTIAPGRILALDGVSFNERSGGAGTGGGAARPFQAFSLALDDPDTIGVDFSLINSGAISGGPTWTSPSTLLSLTGLSGTYNVYFSISDPTGVGAWRIDNFTLTGTVVPLPPAAWLLGSALLPLLLSRHRRS